MHRVFVVIEADEFGDSQIVEIFKKQGDASKRAKELKASNDNYFTDFFVQAKEVK